MPEDNLRKGICLNVTLFMRAGCPKCARALATLERHKLVPEVVDIDQDDELAAKYDCCVPVVTIAGKIRFRGEINEVLLRRLVRKQRGET